MESGPDRGVAFSGFVIAAIGFALTRLVVAETIAASTPPVEFVVVDLPPLALGFGLVILGVGLAVSTFPATYVATVSRWCLAGTAGMVAILGLALVDPMAVRVRPIPATVLVNVLLGGAIGGTLTGIRSAENRVARRELERKHDEATLLNRILRDEVLNAVAGIKGHADRIVRLEAVDDESLTTIEGGADRIESAITDVGFLVRADSDLVPVDLAAAVRESLDAARAAYPDATFEVDDGFPPEIRVDAGTNLATIVTRLLDLAVERSGDDEPTVTVGLGATHAAGRVRISYDGEPISPDERRVFRERRVSRYDDPNVDFDLSVAGLLVERYGGTVDVPDPTTVAVGLPRAVGSVGWSAPRTGRSGVPPVRLRNAAVASVVAGAIMGAVIGWLSGAIPVIGALYGAPNPLVGWISHLVHSVVFGLLFLAGITRSSAVPDDSSAGRYVGLGVGYGVLLWLVAAGIVMPLWLNAIGIPAPVPNLTAASLLGHVIWGGVLGGLYAVLPG